MKVDDYKSLILKEILILQEVNHTNFMRIDNSLINYYLFTNYFESISIYDLLFIEEREITESNKNYY